MSSNRNFPSITPKEASTTKARKTSTKSAASPQIVKTVTSDESNASMEAGIRRVTPKGITSLSLLDLCRAIRLDYR